MRWHRYLMSTLLSSGQKAELGTAPSPPDTRTISGHLVEKRYDAVRTLLKCANRAGAQGLADLQQPEANSETCPGHGVGDCVALSEDDGVHGPCLVARRDVPEHSLVLAVPFALLVNVSSWGCDSKLGRALAAEGVLTNAALLGGGRLVNLEVAESVFQGSEPLLVLWLLLQRRLALSEWGVDEENKRAACEGAGAVKVCGNECKSPVDAVTACHRAYFCALASPQSQEGEAEEEEAQRSLAPSASSGGGVDQTCAFTWPEEALRELLGASPLAARALQAQNEVRRSFNALRGLLAQSSVWRDFLAGAGGGGEEEEVREGSGREAGEGQARDTSGGLLTDDDGAAGLLEEVSFEEYKWAWATVASRAVRFGERGDRASWTSLYLEPVGDLLNHGAAAPSATAASSAAAAPSSSSSSPPRACVFRFLNEGSGMIQYHAEDGGLRKGAELLYAYGPLRPADSLLFYGFAVADPGPSLTENARRIWRRDLLREVTMTTTATVAAAPLLATTVVSVDDSWSQSHARDDLGAEAEVKKNASIAVKDGGRGRASETRDAAGDDRDGFDDGGGGFDEEGTVAAILERYETSLSALASVSAEHKDGHPGTAARLHLSRVRDSAVVLSAERRCILGRGDGGGSVIHKPKPPPSNQKY